MEIIAQSPKEALEISIALTIGFGILLYVLDYFDRKVK